MAHDDLRPTENGSRQDAPESVAVVNGVGARPLDVVPVPRGGTSRGRPGSPGVASFVLLSLMSVSFGMLGAYLYNRFLGPLIRPSNPVVAAASSGESGMAKGESAAASAPDVALAGDLKELKSQYDDLTKRTDGLKDRLDSLPNSDDSPHLTSLQIKVADLSKSAAEVAPLPGKVERLDLRLERLNETVESLRDEVGTAQPGAARAAPAIRGAAPERERRDVGKPVISDAVDANRRALIKGAELFMQGKYQESFDFFSQLELSDPDDARVWYYAALSRGLATSKWGNGTEQLVERGIERERAGTPTSSDIDIAFRGLTSATGKDWLDFYRQRVKEK